MGRRPPMRDRGRRQAKCPTPRGPGDGRPPRPAERPPVPRRNLPEQYGGIAQQARLGGQQVVPRLANPAALHVHADVEQLPLFVVQRAQVHARCQRVQPAAKGRNRLGAAHQRRRQVTRVHRRDIAREKRLARARVIPVVQLAFPLFQRLECLKRRLDAPNTLFPVDQPQLPRAHAAHKVQRRVGRRGAPGQANRRVELLVIGRQAVVLHRVLEKAPGARRQIHQRLPLRGVGRKGLLARPFKVSAQCVGRPPQNAQRHPGQKQQRLERQTGKHCQRAQPRKTHGQLSGFLLRVVGGHPVQQPPLRHALPPQRPADRPQRTRGLERRKRDSAQREQPAVSLPHARPDERQQIGQQRKQDSLRPAQPERGQYQRDLHAGKQTAQQIVAQLEPVDGLQALTLPPAARKRQQLPVAPRPSFKALQPGAQAFGVAFVERHVVDLPRARKQALDQVVTEYAVVRQAALQARGKGACVQYALARINALTRPVLPRVRGAGGIGVHAPRPAEERREFVDLPVQRRLHARSQHRIAGGLAVLDPRPVDRVRHRRDQAQHVLGQHLPARVQRQHERIRPVKARRLQKGVLAQPQVTEQRAQRPPLALVRHVFMIPRLVFARAAQEIILLPPGAPVRPGNSPLRRRQDGLVPGQALLLRVWQVAQQQKVDVPVRLVHAQGFQLVRERLRPRLAAEQRRHDNQRPVFLSRLLQRQAEQRLRLYQARRRAVDQLLGNRPGARRPRKDRPPGQF